MSIVSKRAEFGDPRNSFSAATFRKVLKGFEIGGLPYTEVQFQLKRLLATGVSPGELREVLRRSELIEPLPDYAYREVQDLLDEAIEQDAALHPGSDGALEQEEELDPVALAAELKATHDALESEQARARETEEALSERIIAEEAVRSRLDIAMRESERYQAELRAARNSMESRDRVAAQMRQALDGRDAELAAMRREHAAELQALQVQAAAAAADLAASRDALDKERRKSQEIEHSLINSNSLSGAARESLASREKALAEARQSLAQRDGQFATLKQEYAETQSNLQAARAQASSLAAELAAARSLLESERRKSQETELAGNAQVAKLQARLRDNNALIEKLGSSVRSEAKRATQWQAAAQQRESAAAQILPRIEVPPRVQVAQALSALAKFPVNFRGRHWNLRALPRPIWIGAAILVLAPMIWFSVHRLSRVPSSAAASSAVLMQPATKALPPPGPIDQEPATTGSSPTIDSPPVAATTPAAGKGVTAGAKPATDFQHCRAGGIDACYNAIRWKPSDPLLLSALGDALLRANRPKDALRTYQRVAALAPNLPGVAAKISAIEAKLSAEPGQGNGLTKTR